MINNDLFGAPSLPFVKLLYVISNITTEPSRYFYIDNTDINNPFLAYDSEPVFDICVKFIGSISKLEGNYKDIELNQVYNITEKGSKASLISDTIFREDGTANMYYNNHQIKYKLGTLILYEHQGRRRVYVKINWTGGFFEQWKRLSLYDEVEYMINNEK